MNQSSNNRYEQEYANNAGTRRENDVLLLDQIEAIKNGEAIDTLARFARAYLGMYLDIDNSVPADQRIQLLASPALTDAVLEGFSVILQQDDFPKPEKIADSLVDESPMDIGYILLAGLNILSANNPQAILKLPNTCLASAIGFHFANKTEVDNDWFTNLLSAKQQLVGSTLVDFWLRLIERGTNYLPGLYQVISDNRYDEISRHVVLPVLQRWHNQNKATLRDLLHAGLKLAEHKQLLLVCEQALQDRNHADPGRYVLWLATAFLLAPEKYDMVLTDYAGRSKEKILPLLDFVTKVIQNDNTSRFAISADAIAQLLRIIAPKFSPQQDRYGNLCDNTRKVMYLFYCLAMSADEDAQATIKRLGLIRVMKLYDDILSYVASVQAQQSAWSDMDFDTFLVQLTEQNRIRSRKKWSDRSVKSPS
jgi:hypothetical protein